MSAFFRLPSISPLVPTLSEPARRFAALARNLDALASETRLELLHALRTPRSLQEIRVPGSLTREGENPDRPISRQAVTRHLEQLGEAGLVHRIPAEDATGADTFVLNHERVFALVDELRGLARLRPFAPGAVAPGETVAREELSADDLPAPPRLYTAYGRDDGMAFGLHGPVGSAWRIGRAPDCEISLDYDPYLSGEHAIVHRTATGFVLEDLGSRNGSWVNLARVPPGRPRALAAGDVMLLGRSTLVFQA